MPITGSIEAVNSKPVKTKFGMKPVYSIVVNGNEYEFGFKKPSHYVGQTVSFEAEAKYGRMSIIEGSLSGGGSGAAPAAAPSVTSSKPSAGNVFVTKPFPLPQTHGDRSIVRQNALTNARELLSYVKGKELSGMDDEVIAEKVIKLAYLFEAYSAGDREANAFEHLMKEASA